MSARWRVFRSGEVIKVDGPVWLHHCSSFAGASKALLTCFGFLFSLPSSLVTKSTLQSEKLRLDCVELASLLLLSSLRFHHRFELFEFLRLFLELLLLLKVHLAFECYHVFFDLVVLGSVVVSLLHGSLDLTLKLDDFELLGA